MPHSKHGPRMMFVLFNKMKKINNKADTVNFNHSLIHLVNIEGQYVYTVWYIWDLSVKKTKIFAFPKLTFQQGELTRNNKHNEE